MTHASDPKPRVPLAAALLVLALCHAVPSLAQAEGTGESQTIVVGMRDDAPPFSYIETTGSEVRHKGYLAELCDKIFDGDRRRIFDGQNQTRYRMVVTRVTEQDRFNRLRKNEPRWKPGEDLATARVDLLCDPVTLRVSAKDGREQGIFSPIVYVTGVSFMVRKSGDNKGAPVLGFVGANTTTGRVALQACERDAFDTGETSDTACAAAYRNATAVTPDDAKPEKDYRFRQFGRHNEAIAWFCEPASDGSPKYYFGDQDLIEGQYDHWIASGKDCPNVSKSNPFYSYEPYALLISPHADNIDLVRHVQRRIYEIFSDRSEAVSLFTAHFEGRRMSDPLAYLFLLNGVEPIQSFGIEVWEPSRRAHQAG